MDSSEPYLYTAIVIAGANYLVRILWFFLFFWGKFFSMSFAISSECQVRGKTRFLLFFYIFTLTLLKKNISL
jgi:hypothetical protein